MKLRYAQELLGKVLTGIRMSSSRDTEICRLQRERQTLYSHTLSSKESHEMKPLAGALRYQKRQVYGTTLEAESKVEMNP